MVYPVITDNFELDVLNANFAELKAFQTKTEETPVASNLGTVTTILAQKICGSVRFKLEAMSGTWTAGIYYPICTLSTSFRPSTAIRKEILLRNGTQAFFYIVNGVVGIVPRTSASAVQIYVDETFII